MQKILPPFYYLDHFQDLIRSVDAKYLEETHLHFLSDFKELSKFAQSLYVRFVNRKGRFFSPDDLRYPEIENIPEALEELRRSRFIRELTPEDREHVLPLLSKPVLLNLCPGLKRSWSKEVLVEAAKSTLPPLENFPKLIVQDRTEALSYILYLYFGEVTENLSLYTLRDLGVMEHRQSVTRSKFKTREESLSTYFYAKASLDGSLTPESIPEWPTPLSEEAELYREGILLALAEEKRKENALEEAVAILAASRAHPGREKRIRWLYQLERSAEAKAELDRIWESPSCDEELLFAENFLRLKFGQGRTTTLTDLLKSAEVLPVDEAHFRHPEAGVTEYYKHQGQYAFHGENHLWRSLFGILFWEEIFQSDLNTFHSPFERLPSELQSSQFYLKHQTAFEEKLNLLGSPDLFFARLEKLKESEAGRQNGLFSWNDELLEALKVFVSQAPPASIGRVLRDLAQGFHDRASGFPDLMVAKEGIRFIEVKAPGDSLRQKQLLKIQLLRDAGFPVDILRVEYRLNPAQTYVVVDLETTGGPSAYHRITEIGAVKLKGGVSVEKFQTLINPQRTISRQIEALTGISNAMVKDAPAFKDVAESFAKFCEGSIFVAHNVQFDYGFLQSEYQRLEQNFVRPFLCTKSLMRKHYPGLPSYGLKSLTEHFAIPLVDHHRALCDAEAAAALLNLINQKR